MGGEHTSHSASLAEMSKHVIEHRLFIVRQQTSVWRQRLQLLIHTHPPCWYTSAHASATASGMEEATQGGCAEGEVIRAHHG